MHIDGVDNFIEAQIICYTDNYNSFFRVKNEMIDKGLLEIKKDGKNKKYILLTKKGIQVYDKLIEINELINQNV